MLKKTGLTENGYDRIVLGGLSQGCAASITTLLAGDRRLAGYIGMSGWLPFEAELSDISKDIEDISAKNRLASSLQAVNHLRNMLNLEPRETAPQLQTPVFLGHGDADEKISIDNGRKMKDLLGPEGLHECDLERVQRIWTLVQDTG